MNKTHEQPIEPGFSPKPQPRRAPTYAANGQPSPSPSPSPEPESPTGGRLDDPAPVLAEPAKP